MPQILTFGEARSQAPKPRRGARRRPPDHGAADLALTDERLATLIGEAWRSRIAFVEEWGGAWFRFDGATWRRERVVDRIAEVRAFLVPLAEAADPKDGRKLLDATRIYAIARLTASSAGIPVAVDAWDRDPWLLGTPGGTVDLRTGELRRARASDFISKCTAVAPAAEGTEAPLWRAFLAETFGEAAADVVPFLQRFLGYSLTGFATEHKLLFAHGPGGNGKGTLFGSVMRLLGDYAQPAPGDLLLASHNERHPTELAGLRGSRLVVMSEVAAGRRWDEPKLKMLTGGDKISARFMRGDFFSFEPTFGLVVFGNHLPAVSSPDDAMRRRMILLPFDRKPTAPDPSLPARLIDEEGPAILRWLIEGAREWDSEGLQVPESLEEATTDYLEAEDVLGDWLAERCVTYRPDAEMNDGTGTTTLYDDFKAWAKARNLPELNVTKFAKRLKSKHFRQHRKNSGRQFVGIWLAS
jgi:putative DNA primase/helicase